MMLENNAHSFVLEEAKNSVNWKRVTEVARDIEAFIKENQEAINAANRPGESSKNIENLFEVILKESGFGHEPKKEYVDRGLCPDFVNREMKTIVEVERGKILQNNMDMLDFWKTHIHGECEYLILIVPKLLRHSEGTRPEKPLEKVSSRLGAFFEGKNKTNVKGLVIIGY